MSQSASWTNRAPNSACDRLETTDPMSQFQDGAGRVPGKLRPASNSTSINMTNNIIIGRYHSVIKQYIDLSPVAEELLVSLQNPWPAVPDLGYVQSKRIPERRHQLVDGGELRAPGDLVDKAFAEFESERRAARKWSALLGLSVAASILVLVGTWSVLRGNWEAAPGEPASLPGINRLPGAYTHQVKAELATCEASWLNWEVVHTPWQFRFSAMPPMPKMPCTMLSKPHWAGRAPTIHARGR